MTSRDWLKAAIARLESSGAPDAALDSEWMLADALGVGRAQLLFMLDEHVPLGALTTLDAWLAARENGSPLQYVQRRAYFMGHEFYVDERVLIPRQDTEILCEAAVTLIKGRGYSSALDLCTGSGAIGISIALACPGARVALADISDDALSVARRNTDQLGATADLVQGDLFAAVPGRKFDLIASNPPYITDADMASLQREVRREPTLALRGGPDGLMFYRRIAAQYKDHLNPGGTLLLEVGYDQAQSVAQLLGNGAFKERDLSGIERVVGITI